MDQVKITAKYYGSHADAWAAQKTNSFYHEKAFEVFLRYLKKGQSVIDIGCAYGIHVPLFLGRGRHLKYEGLDISKNFLKIAVRHYPQLKFYQANILDKKSLPKKKYDAFWSAATLMHIPEERWDEMLDNIEKLVRKGAAGYVTVPADRPNPANDVDQRHFTLFPAGKFEKLVQPRGWKILKKGHYDHSDGRSKMWHWYIVQLP